MSQYHHSGSYVTLPLLLDNEETCCTRATTELWKYLGRMFQVNQMDFANALMQMMYLFISPQKVYSSVQYGKNTKSEFARDDPAFIVLLIAWFCFISTGFGMILRLDCWHVIKFLSYVIFFDCIGSGLVFATIFWYVLNKCFHLKTNQKIEWRFAFDVHLNALFPALTLIQWCQLLVFTEVLLYYDWFLIMLIGNTFWLIAVSYYIYITFLGYNSLQVLKHATFLLIPLLISVLLYVMSLIVKFNIAYVWTLYYTDG
ncbi:hypothetical protein ILUMI_02193, partial [Ignelater luminosus]